MIKRHTVTLDFENNYTHTLYIVPVDKGPTQTWKKKNMKSYTRKGVLLVIPYMHWSCFIKKSELPETDEEEERLYLKLFEELYDGSFFHTHAKEVAGQIALILRSKN